MEKPLNQDRVNEVIQHGLKKGVFKVSAKDIDNDFNHNQMDYIANQIMIELANAGFQITKTKTNTSITDSKPKYDVLLKPVIWSELRDDFSDDGWIHIDAWTGEDENESGKVIAKINQATGEVIYLDERAKSDSEAQDIIMRNVWKIVK